MNALLVAPGRSCYSMGHMQALQLLAHGSPGTFALGNVPDPSPDADEVVVRVRACGLNHLDLWLEEGALPIQVQFPRTPGCEIAGEIAEIGASVPAWNVGDRVAVQSNIFCGCCEFCRRGQESLCINYVMLGVERDGGLAEKVVVPSRALLRLPAGVSFRTSAGLSLAGSTAMHMLTERTAVRAGDWVLVIGGASGVGSAAIQIAKSLGAQIISTGSTPAKRQLAQELGAAFALDTAEADWPAQVRKITNKRGVGVIIEHVGGDVLGQCFNCLARGGTIVTCGATAGRHVTLDIWPFFVKQQRLVGSYGRNRVDLEKTLDWAAAGKLRPAIDAVYSLKDAPSAFERLRQRGVLGKLIIEP